MNIKTSVRPQPMLALPAPSKAASSEQTQAPAENQTPAETVDINFDQDAAKAEQAKLAKKA